MENRGLPDSKAGGHIASQLLRAGTSPAPNYAEARGAESDRDFVHKMKVVLKELNECLVWLAIIQEGEMLAETELRSAREECTAMCRITAASINTVNARLGAKKESPGVSFFVHPPGLPSRLPRDEARPELRSGRRTWNPLIKSQENITSNL